MPRDLTSSLLIMAKEPTRLAVWFCSIDLRADSGISFQTLLQPSQFGKPFDIHFNKSPSIRIVYTRICSLTNTKPPKEYKEHRKGHI